MEPRRDERGASLLAPREWRGNMNPMSVLRVVVLIVSGAAMIVGLLGMFGVLVPRNFPGEYRVVVGVVVFLYGLHRFVVVFFRQPKRES
jgi:hypothetical protein